MFTCPSLSRRPRGRAVGVECQCVRIIAHHFPHEQPQAVKTTATAFTFCSFPKQYFCSFQELFGKEYQSSTLL
jgi:hypothetical protein